MAQTIKPNDLVYIPSETNTLQKVIRDSNNLVIDDGYNRFTINEQGCKYDFDVASWGTQPFAFLATPEIKEKLEQVYGKLEDIPVDEEVEEFSKALNELSTFYTKLYSSDGNFRPSDKMEELKSIKNNLIQMFKERGSK